MRGAFLFIIYRLLMRNFLRVIVGVKYINAEVLSNQKQFIIVSNHNSHMDTMAIMSVLKLAQLEKVHPVAAGDYFGKSPLMAYITKLFTNALLIQRTKTLNGQNPIELMFECLDKGDSLILFPEGSRGEPQKMQQFKKGIGIVLQKYPNIAYIPVYMQGMGKILPKGESLLVPFDAYVVFGEPAYSKSNKVEDIVIEVEENIVQLSQIFYKRN
jgi:1-acyl-sn-glycerol-3-phosphate acyltransferase